MSVITPHIINGLRRGDEWCFGLIFKNYFKQLHSFAIRYLKSSSTAEIVVQDLFILLWNKRDTLFCSTERELVAWLYTSLRHLCLRELQHIAKEKRYHCELLENECLLNIQSLNDDADQVLSYNHTLSIIDKAVEKLPEQCRRVFKLSRNENLRNGEIAERLNISVKAVEANITRAIKELQIILKEYSLNLLILISLIWG